MLSGGEKNFLISCCCVIGNSHNNTLAEKPPPGFSLCCLRGCPAKVLYEGYFCRIVRNSAGWGGFGALKTRFQGCLCRRFSHLKRNVSRIFSVNVSPSRCALVLNSVFARSAGLALPAFLPKTDAISPAKKPKNAFVLLRSAIVAIAFNFLCIFPGPEIFGIYTNFFFCHKGHRELRVLI
jgi:hypothetical protein